LPFDPKHKILFVHIPKTGGTSIEQFFDMCHAKNFWFDRWDRDRDDFLKKHQTKCSSPKLVYEPQHYPIEVLKELIEDYDDYFKFTFVRNPYTKLLSEYFWRENKQYLSTYDFIPEQFDAWCEEMLSDLDDSHKESQLSFVDPTINFIGKFEHFEADFQSLLRLLSKNSRCICRFQNRKLSYLNTTGLSKIEIIPRILEKTKQRIVRIYRKDFEIFNYEY
jgi:hypothetical protein